MFKGSQLYRDMTYVYTNPKGKDKHRHEVHRKMFESNPEKFLALYSRVEARDRARWHEERERVRGKKERGAVDMGSDRVEELIEGLLKEFSDGSADV